MYNARQVIKNMCFLFFPWDMYLANAASDRISLPETHARVDCKNANRRTSVQPINPPDR